MNRFLLLALIFSTSFVHLSSALADESNNQTISARSSEPTGEKTQNQSGVSEDSVTIAKPVMPPENSPRESERATPKKTKWRYNGREIFSADAREGRHFFLAAQPVGLTGASAIDWLAGASIGAYVYRDLLVLFDGSFAFSPFASSDYGTGETLSEYGIHAKYFVYKFIFVKAGFAHRSYSTSYRNYSSEQYKTTSIEQEAWDVGIGAQFQFKILTFGCDAITVYNPIWTHVKSDSDSHSDSTPNVELLKIYAGISF